MRDGNEIEAGNARQVRTQTRIRSTAKIEEAPDSGLAKIGIDENGLIAKLSKSHSEICGRGGFAFAGKSAGDKNDLRRMIGLRKKNGGTQGAERFRHLRFRKMLGHQLNAFFVAVGGRARQQG